MLASLLYSGINAIVLRPMIRAIDVGLQSHQCML